MCSKKVRESNREQHIRTEVICLRKYVVKRILISIVILFFVGFIIYALMRCLPTDYYFTEEQLMKFTEEQKYAALEAAGLTDPIGTQLLHFYNDLLHLDFGTAVSSATAGSTPCRCLRSSTTASGSPS